ncbi:MAG: hypothetical protein U0525_02215 [Patescibacteria group bacterium]
MKTIVTHINPDQDALSSVWLIRKYYPGFQGDDVEYGFVAAGQTYKKMVVDSDPDIVHVDTGLGRFDHHQIPEKLSAFKRIYEEGLKNNWFPSYDINALGRMCGVINAYDNFQEVYFPNPTADYFDFTLDQAISGLIHTKMPDAKKVEITLPFFDSILQVVKNKIKAETNVKEGIEFETKAFGKSLVMSNTNNDSMKYAQKLGFQLVARKDPEKGIIRIVCVPNDSYDLTPIRDLIVGEDKVGTWFLHQSRHMLLNGSLVNPTMVPSPITFERLVEILRSF